MSRARGVAGIARAAIGRVAAPPGSAWPTAKPAGTRHRSLAVPYRGGGSTRSIRRLVSVRSITDGRAARGRSAGIGRLTGRHRTAIMIMVVAALATLAVVSPRIVAWRQAEATRPQVGGAAQPPPGFAAGPGGSGPAVLVGSYRTVSSAPGGYRGEVTVRNVGDVGVDDWTVTITLPLPGQVVTGGRGARYRQSGRTVAFTPADGAGPVGPRGLLRVEFTVSGAGPPIGCTLDGRPCEGVSG